MIFTNLKKSSRLTFLSMKFWQNVSCAYQKLLTNKFSFCSGATLTPGYVHEVSLEAADLKTSSFDVYIIAGIISLILITASGGLCLFILMIRKKFYIRRSSNACRMETKLGTVPKLYDPLNKFSKSVDSKSSISENDHYEICPYATFGSVE